MTSTLPKKSGPPPLRWKKMWCLFLCGVWRHFRCESSSNFDKDFDENVCRAHPWVYAPTWHTRTHMTHLQTSQLGFKWGHMVTHPAQGAFLTTSHENQLPLTFRLRIACIWPRYVKCSIFFKFFKKIWKKGRKWFWAPRRHWWNFRLRVRCQNFQKNRYASIQPSFEISACYQ